MSNIPRRTINELKARYLFEPSLRDIYVEGIFDKQIIISWCNKNNKKNIIPYEINTVDIPSFLLDKYDLTEGNKQRVVALAKELSLIESESYYCLVDKDLDHWFGDLDNTRKLLWTEYSSLELYFFSEELIKRIIVDVSGAKIKEWKVFYSSFVLVLKKLYALRLSDRKMNLNINWIDINKSLGFNGSNVGFDYVKYAKSCLISNGLHEKIDEFMSELDSWFDKLNCDPRLCIRGHDFVDLVAISNKSYRSVKSFQNSEAIQRLFVAFIDEVDDLIQSMK